MTMIEAWLEYLSRMEQTPGHEADFVIVREVWTSLSEQWDLKPPQAFVCEDGGVQLHWGAKPHYLEVDVAGGKVSWFYANRETRAYQTGGVDDLAAVFPLLYPDLDAGRG